jgi:hypothetical protein
MSHPLASAHLAVSAIILLWDIFLAGQIAGLRAAPRAFAALTALAGLLAAPALLVALAAASTLYGRAIHGVAWIWPLTLTLFAAQAVYATGRALVTPLIGVPIAAYDVVIAAAGWAEYALSAGAAPPAWVVTLVAAERSALAVSVSPAALWSPVYLYVPALAPSFPPRWRGSAGFRTLVATFAAAWANAILIELPIARSAVRSYDDYADERLQERPRGDFEVGLTVFPDLTGGPPPLSLRNDVALADTIGVDAIHVVVEPRGATPLALDSLARSVDELRRGGARLLVSLGYSAGALAPFRATPPLDEAARLRAITRLVRRLRPDYLVPAVEPYGAGARVYGTLPPNAWQGYFARAAAAAHRVNRRVSVMYVASAYTARDSVLFAWAASPGSPVDAVGLALAPSRRGAIGLGARIAAGERWLRATPSPKETWAFAAALPLTHGEQSQERALWAAMAWATRQPRVAGIVISEAGDYERQRGLRASDGRLRPAALAIRRAAKALEEARETAGAQ